MPPAGQPVDYYGARILCSYPKEQWRVIRTPPIYRTEKGVPWGQSEPAAKSFSLALDAIDEWRALEAKAAKEAAKAAK